MTSPATPQRPAPSRSIKVAAGIITAIIFALCIGGGTLAAVSGGEDDPDPVADDNSIGAEIACEEFIGRRLKAPATAKYTHQQAEKSGARYVVSGTVDSENSFGAMIRNHYTCTVTDQGDKWHLDDLKLTGR